MADHFDTAKSVCFIRGLEKRGIAAVICYKGFSRMRVVGLCVDYGYIADWAMTDMKEIGAKEIRTWIFG